MVVSILGCDSSVQRQYLMFANQQEKTKNVDLFQPSEVKKHQFTLPTLTLGKFTIDFNQRKTQIITGVVILLLLVGGWAIHRHNSGPMTDHPVASSQWQEQRSSNDTTDTVASGSTAKQSSGRHIPDGLH